MQAFTVLSQQDSVPHKPDSLFTKWEYGASAAYGSRIYKGMRFVRYCYSQQLDAGAYAQYNTKNAAIRFSFSLGIVDLNMKTLNSNPYYYSPGNYWGLSNSYAYRYYYAKDYKKYSDAERGKVYQKFNYLNLDAGISLVLLRNLPVNPVLGASFSFYSLVNSRGLGKHTYDPDVVILYGPQPGYKGSYAADWNYSYDRQLSDVLLHFGLQHSRGRLTYGLFYAKGMAWQGVEVFPDNFIYSGPLGVSTGFKCVANKTISFMCSYRMSK